MGIERIRWWGWMVVGLAVGALFAAVYTEEPSDSVERVIVDDSRGRQDWEGGLLTRLTRDWTDSEGKKHPVIDNLRILPPKMGGDGIMVQEATFDFLKPADPKATRRKYFPGRALEPLPFPQKIALIVTAQPTAYETIGTMLLDTKKKHRQPIKATTLADAQRALRENTRAPQPDIVICELMIDGKEIARPLMAETIAGLRREKPKVIILADPSEEQAAKDALRYGAVGYVLKASKEAWATALEKSANPDAKISAEGKAELGKIHASLNAGVSAMFEKAFPDQTLRAEIEKLRIAQAKDPKALQFSYRYVWWAEKRARYTVWMAAGALVIGVIWPLILSLLTGAGFGRGEPAEPQKVRYSAGKEEPKPVKAAVTDEDQQKLLDLEAAMEAKLAASGMQMTAPAAVEEEESAEIKTLSATPLEAPKEIRAPEEPKEYKGEYYPTATRATKKK